MRIYGPKELLEDVFGKDLCIGCGGCVNLCPYIKNYRGKTTMLFPCTLDAGRCNAYCPKVEVNLDELTLSFCNKPYDGSPLGNYQEILTARSGRKTTGGAYQAGGTVSALMTFALEESRIDSAVLTAREELIPVPKLVTQPEDVAKCAGSKFMASPTLEALNQGVKDGYSRIGVVGTPCQVMSVAQMRSDPLNTESFQDPIELVVGLFCTWAIDTRGLIPLLSECVDSACIVGMDLPPPPSEIMIIDTGKTKVEIPLDRIRPLIPKACSICPDMTSEWADVSVGVLEGKSDWNTVIIRTEKGADLVNTARKAGFLVTEGMPAENLQHLCLAAAGKKKRALAQAKEEHLLNTREDAKRAALRIPEDVVNKILTEDVEAVCRTY
ncbi:MAG: Coenzyme F420 hydrogenase/dehydrogenase, beta subunit C-terminal domain [Desulfobacterales bacterium]|jgi:coenzyme F420 hydrogenase subunit beta